MAPQHPLGIRISKLITTDRKLAAEMAFKAVFTPSKTKITEEQRKILSAATPSWDLIGRDKLAIRTYVFRPSTTGSGPVKTVLLSPSHGRAANSMLKFVPALISAGCQVVAIDHNAHGESAGDVYDMQLGVETMEVLMRKYAPLHAVIGHSVGSTVTVAALAANPEIQCPRLVCMAPPLQIATTLAFTLAALGVDKTLLADVYHIAAEESWMTAEDIKKDIAKSELNSRTKLLVIHDVNDRTVLFDEAEWMASRFEYSRVQRTRGLKHYGLSDDEATIDMATKFAIEEPPIPGSSGVSSKL